MLEVHVFVAKISDCTCEICESEEMTPIKWFPFGNLPESMWADDPLWLPQLGMAIGTLVLLIAFLDELVLEWRGQRALPDSAEMLRNE